MGYNELARLFQDFERYDRHITEYSTTTTKAQRFNDYLAKMKSMIEKLQQVLADNNIDTAENEYTTINEHDIKVITTAATYYFRLNKRNAAAACQ